MSAELEYSIICMTTAAWHAYRPSLLLVLHSNMSSILIAGMTSSIEEYPSTSANINCHPNHYQQCVMTFRFTFVPSETSAAALFAKSSCGMHDGTEVHTKGLV